MSFLPVLQAVGSSSGGIQTLDVSVSLRHRPTMSRGRIQVRYSIELDKLKRHQLKTFLIVVRTFYGRAGTRVERPPTVMTIRAQRSDVTSDRSGTFQDSRKVPGTPLKRARSVAQGWSEATVSQLNRNFTALCQCSRKQIPVGAWG